MSMDASELTEEAIREKYADEIKEMADHMLTEKKAEHKGVKVFCLRCGSYGNRTPFRKYNNYYLCENCYKIVKAEEKNRKENK